MTSLSYDFCDFLVKIPIFGFVKSIALLSQEEEDAKEKHWP
uniref:Uncharacterized protein n=1 Tax=Arundo donax TaxID=35708 RepID=A0A0A9G8W0_ARUDO